MTEREDELCAVVRRGGEDRDLDYKEPMAWDEGDTACIGLVKDILAMANGDGGYLVIGVAERGGTYDWKGLEQEALKTWDTTRLGNTINKYADPPVELRLRKLVCEGRNYVVIAVPPFVRSPHFCKRSYEKDGNRVLTAAALYVRTSNAESAPIQTVADFQDLVERAVRTRQDQMLTAMRSILTGASLAPTESDQQRFEDQIAAALAEATDPFADKGYDAYYTDSMFPARFQPDRYGLGDLRRAAEAASVNYVVDQFLYYPRAGHEVVPTNDGLRMQGAGQRRRGNDYYDFWTLKQSGLLVRRTLMWEAGQYPTARIVDPKNITRHVGTALDALVRYYTELGIRDEAITWRFRIDGTMGRELTALGDYHMNPGQIAQIPFIEYSKTFSIEEWRAGLVDIGAEAVLEVLKRFGWENEGGPFADWIQKLYVQDI